MRREPAGQLRLLGVDGILLLRRGGRDVVRLVQDKQVERLSLPGELSLTTQRWSRTSTRLPSPGAASLLGPVVPVISAIIVTRAPWP